MEALIEPKALTWARETFGLQIEVAAEKLHVSREKLVNWENGKDKPSLRQLEKIAQLYKRPSAVFYLREIPQSSFFPVDYRSLTQEKRIHPSPETLLAIRRARRMQKINVELSKELEIPLYAEPIFHATPNNAVQLADEIRAKLAIDIQTQFAWQNEKMAISSWKQAIEKMGVMVAELRFPIEEGRAFSLFEATNPIIVLNASDAVNAKIFSMFHELGHILLHKVGICNWKENIKDSSLQSYEVFANSFAGNFLVPNNILKQYESIVKADLNKSLDRFSQLFKVSKQVVLRKLLITGHIDINTYQLEEKLLKKEYEELANRPKFGRRNYASEYFNANGKTFANLVFNAYRAEIISYGDISEFLNVKAKYIPGFENILSGNK